MPSPYDVAASTITRESLMDLVSDGCEAFRSQATFGAMDLGHLVRCLDELSSLPATRLGTVGQVADRTANTAIRVDVDMDLPHAVALSTALRAASIPATFYLLHTAGYYGWVQGSRFERHATVADDYRRLAACGEIGLHLDPFGLFETHDIDGLAAVRTELDWLRSLGIAIDGVSAHNAAPVHGRENFEVFSDWVLDAPDGFASNVEALVGQLDATELGITYLAGSPLPGHGGESALLYLAESAPSATLQDETWMRSYLHDMPYCRWGDDVRVWLIGDDRWIISADSPGTDPLASAPVWDFDVDWATVRSRLRDRAAEQSAVVTLHPIYIRV